MKKKVLVPAFMVLFLFLVKCSFSQNYDLIVTTKGDSISCHIDSIAESHIFFEMKTKGSWAHTSISLSQVSFYERNVIAKEQYLFEPGTSIIKSVKTGTLPKNSVYVGIMTLNYARTFLGNPVGITLAGGVLYIDAPGVLLETSLLVGGSKHFFEPGIMGFHIFASNPSSEESNSTSGINVRIGYRFQSRSGFLFRTAPVISFVDGGVVLLPALSIGFSF